jgi:hypothetical protein
MEKGIALPVGCLGAAVHRMVLIVLAAMPADCIGRSPSELDTVHTVNRVDCPVKLLVAISAVAERAGMGAQHTYLGAGSLEHGDAVAIAALKADRIIVQNLGVSFLCGGRAHVAIYSQATSSRQEKTSAKETFFSGLLDLVDEELAELVDRDEQTTGLQERELRNEVAFDIGLGEHFERREPMVALGADTATTPGAGLLAGDLVGAGICRARLGFAFWTVHGPPLSHATARILQ